MKKILAAALICAALGLAGCAVSPHEGLMDTSNGASQLSRRQIQTRYFETNDKQKTMECVMATLQDLGFVIDKASLDLGSLTATKLSGYRIRMTVSIIPRGEKQMTVRANAQYNIHPIEDPIPYQQFFDALAKSMFLQAHMED